ncbi:MAG: SDR family NAD(P)-dependent oxidoreductase [Armatimonadota bacterium]
MGPILNDKNALVTGSSSGIGAGIAKYFAGLGANIGVNFRTNAEGGEETARAVRAAGSRPVVIRADISSADDVQRMFREFEEALGRIDILVNNAGITPKVSLMDTDEDAFDEVVGTNLKGTLMCSREAAGRMQNRGGAILNISSTHAAATRRGFGMYGPTKAGIEMLTKAAAVEWGECNIRVNCLRVGFISVERDPMTPDDPRYEGVCRRIPVGRPGTPEDIAPVAALLCSDLTDFITGAVLPVDGGASCRQATSTAEMERIQRRLDEQ